MEHMEKTELSMSEELTAKTESSRGEMTEESEGWYAAGSAAAEAPETVETPEAAETLKAPEAVETLKAAKAAETAEAAEATETAKVPEAVESRITAATAGAGAGKDPENKAVGACGREIAAALLMYPLAWVYVRYFLWGISTSQERIPLLLFTLGFLALAELLFVKIPRSRESWLWLGCLAVVLSAILLERGRVWEGWEYVFLHLFAVWWVLSRAGVLYEGYSGSLLPLDGLRGFVLLPFGNYFLRLRVLIRALIRLRGERKRTKPETVAWSLAAIVAGCVLLYLAADLLTAADEGFYNLLSGLLEALRPHWDEYSDLFVLRLCFSLLVGAYIFGLLGGGARADRAAVKNQAAGIRRGLESLRQAPCGVWAAVTGIFCLLYLLFFAVQARYLFGAFYRTLPEGFIVSEYARQGFFELCRVMAVNFVLLWLALRTSRTEDGTAGRVLRGLCLLLLAESLLLAVVAFSKLALYISCFGFTPRRLQSTWLVCVLAFGCICQAVSLLWNRRTFRLWLAFGAVTLSLLCLY